MPSKPVYKHAQQKKTLISLTGHHNKTRAIVNEFSFTMALNPYNYTSIKFHACMILQARRFLLLINSWVSLIESDVFSVVSSV